MKLGSKTFRKTLVKPISVSNPGSGKKKNAKVYMDKKGFYWGGGETREARIIFPNQKVGSHGLINKTNYLKLGLSQKI